MKRVILFLTLLIFIVACKQASVPDSTAQPETPVAIDTQRVAHNALKLYNTLSAKGETVYKENCAACHCSSSSNCEGSQIVRFRRCETLSADSLTYLKNFISNSKQLKDAGNTSAVKAYRETKDTYDHDFRQLSEEEKNAVFVYICGN